jgi:hypothetical protein
MVTRYWLLIAGDSFLAFWIACCSSAVSGYGDAQPANGLP